MQAWDQGWRGKVRCVERWVELVKEPRGCVDTNVLRTAALQRRPAAGGPLRWGSVLQEAKTAEVSDIHPS